MDKPVERVVGTGMTQRTKRSRSIDARSPKVAEKLTTAFAAYNRELVTPWGVNAKILDAIRREAAALEAVAPSAVDDLEGHNSFYQERVTEAWYLATIVMEAKIAELAITEGRPWEAVSSGLLMGELLTELRMKLAWEPFALTGQKVHAGKDAARRGDQAARVEEVDRLAAEIGRGGKTAAFRLVAERQGVTAKAIETDYYNAKRKLS